MIILKRFTDWVINGKMSKRLLHKTTFILLLFSVVTLLVSAPIFYFIINGLYLDEADETLLLHHKEFVHYNLPDFKDSDIAVWNSFNRNVKILPDRNLTGSTLFSTFYYDKLDEENEPYRELNVPIVIEGKRYTYMGRTNLIEKEDLIGDMALLYVVMIVLLLTGIIIINNRISKKVWRPFYATLDQIREFEIDKSRRPQFEVTPIAEFNRLNSTLERLIEKNTSIYRAQREFIENASHELQTPLALFQSKVDHLYQMEGLSKEQVKIISGLNSDIVRLRRLNKNLLLLSKIENDAFPERQDVVVNSYLKKHFDFFTEQAKAKGIHIIFDFKNTLLLHWNVTLVEVLVSNLFLNAIRHNVHDGKIVVSIEGMSLTFANTGASTALLPGKLFERFSKTNPSSNGNGLGLAIVKKVADNNNAAVYYFFEDGMHCFRVDF